MNGRKIRSPQIRTTYFFVSIHQSASAEDSGSDRSPEKINGLACRRCTWPWPFVFGVRWAKGNDSVCRWIQVLNKRRFKSSPMVFF